MWTVLGGYDSHLGLRLKTSLPVGTIEDLRDQCKGRKVTKIISMTVFVMFIDHLIVIGKGGGKGYNGDIYMFMCNHGETRRPKKSRLCYGISLEIL
jgi:hypothetical protein